MRQTKQLTLNECVC